MTPSAVQPGHGYIVGVGPGAPDLLTLRAAEVLRSVEVVMAPRSDRGDHGLALDVVRPLLSAGQEVIERIYPMRRDPDATRAAWAESAAVFAARIAAGRSVAFITLGDPLLYSTAAYLIEALTALVPPDRLHVVPGISAFQAAAARFGEPLTVQEDRLTLMSAGDLAAVAAALDACETLVLYKAGGRLAAIRALLEERGLAGQGRAISYVEREGDETVMRDLSEAVDDGRYLTTVIVHVGRRAWREGAE
jgi:precorrin-2/cobalt-factor-2 C20-methyltransferase